MSEHRLDELCEILDAKRVPLSAMQRAKRQGSYPYYGAQSIIDYVDDYLLDGKYLLVAEDGANLVTRTQDIANIVRFAPSACNTQPWRVLSSDNELKVYRYRKAGKRGIMPKDKVIYYNQIDIGIFLCFLELCLEKNKLSYKKELYVEENHDNEYNLAAVYKIKNSR